MKSFETLKTTKEYSKIYKKGASFHSSSFVIFFLKSTQKHIGFVASKKVGNAVCRNRCKRLLREIFYHSCNNLHQGSYVFVAKKNLLKLDFHMANTEFGKILMKFHSKKAMS